jgi:hypothetical protein
MKNSLALMLLASVLFWGLTLNAQQSNPIFDDLNIQTGYYCDGEYSKSTDYAKYLANLSLSNFTISCQFNANESRRHWVFVMGSGYRWLGFLINANNQISFTANNQDYTQLTDGVIEPSKWYTATVVHNNGTTKVFLDDKEIGSYQIEFVVPAGGDNTFTTTNYSNGTAFKGYIRALKVWNESLTPKQVAKLAVNKTKTAEAPLIVFRSPSLSYTQTKESEFELIACIESSEILKTFQIYINGYASRGFKLAENNTCAYAVEKTIELIEGKNTIKIVAENSGGISTSNTFVIEYIIDKKDITPPEIKIISPTVTRGSIIFEATETIEVKGVATDAGGLKSITINEISAAFDASGNFTQNIDLEEGQNTFVVVAIDNSGNKNSTAFTIQNKGNSTPSNEPAENQINASGNYYALIIGVEEYQDPNITSLDQPIKDAEKLYNIISTNYTFASQNIKFLKNPGANEITAALEEYYTKLSKEDNLLIFYAGHGYWDEKFDQGYWLAADAERSNRGTWLSNSTIRDYMKAIPAKHTLLITDACFGGGIFKSRNAFSNASVAINQLYKYPSRKAMTSGALSEVPDQSVFIQLLVSRLDENMEKYLSSEELFNSFKVAVINNSANGQIPQYGEVKQTGDEGGDFIFIKK